MHFGLKIKNLSTGKSIHKLNVGAYRLLVNKKMAFNYMERRNAEGGTSA